MTSSNLVKFPIVFSDRRSRKVLSRNILFQLPSGEEGNFIEERKSVDKAASDFRNFHSIYERIKLGLHVVSPYTQYVHDVIPDLGVEVDGTVVLANEHYTAEDLSYTLTLLKDKRLQGKPLMIFCSRAEFQFLNGGYPPESSLKDGRMVSTPVPAETHTRFDLVRAIKAIEGTLQYRSLQGTSFPNYPGKCTDPEYYFTGFENVGQAFSNEMGCAPRRKAFLRYGRITAQEAHFL